jgi:endonuclease/exonuclease/phosphatase family metal-dependent hydrolase
VTAELLAGAAVALRVMTYNVHSCKGRDGKIRPERIAAVVARYQPDVVALQEVRVGAVDQPGAIAAALGMRSAFFPLVRLEKEEYGIAVLSRHPMRTVRAAALPTHPASEKRGALWVELDVRGTKVQLINTHLGLTGADRSRQSEALLGPDWVGAAKTPPLVVCGDLNSGARGRPYKGLSAVMSDAARTAGRAPPRTFPSRLPLLRLDHVFVSTGARVASLEAPSTDLTRAASDHLPVIAELVFEPERR